MHTDARALDLAATLARKAGRLLLDNLPRRRTIDTKGHSSNLVTDMDRASEAMIVRSIRRAFPDHVIVAEESGTHASSSGCRWFVDPLDGTTNYAHGFPMFCVSIGFEVDGVRRAGAVYSPALDELFTARLGRGAHRNGKRIRCSTQSRLDRALLCTGFPYQPAYRIENLRWWNAFIRKAQAVRRIGSAAMDLCWTAAGIFDGFWEFHLGPWDIAAAALIAEEAGATVSDWKGRGIDLFQGEILAAGPKLHPLMKRLLSN